MPWLFFMLGSWHRKLQLRQMHAAVGKNRQWNKARYDVLSIPGYDIKKKSYPRSQTWNIYAAVHVLQGTWNAEDSPQAQKVVTKTFCTDGTMMTNTASLCQILGGLRNRSFNTMKSQWKTIPSWPHGKKDVGTRNPGQILWMQKVFKGHWLSRSEAKMQNKVWRTYSNHWRWKQTSSSWASGNGLINNLNALKNTITDSGWRHCLSSTTHSYSSSRW